MSVFSERLKQLRENKKKENSTWLQEYVADKLGVARTTYTAYENGTKQPPMETVKKIADIFHTTTDYLHGRTDIVNDIFSEVSDAIEITGNSLLNKKLLLNGVEIPEKKAKQAIQIFRQVLQIEVQEEDN